MNTSKYVGTSVREGRTERFVATEFVVFDGHWILREEEKTRETMRPVCCFRVLLLALADQQIYIIRSIEDEKSFVLMVHVQELNFYVSRCIFRYIPNIRS